MDDEEAGVGGFFGFSLHDLLVPGLVAMAVALVVSLATVLVVKGGQDDTIKQASAAAREQGAREGATAAVKAIRKSQVVACGRTQVTRGLDRFQLGSAVSLAPDLREVNRLTRAYDQILDCRKTYVENDGKAVPLPNDLQECFVALVGSGYFIENDPQTQEKPLRTICIAEKLP